jgi:hypothetical protein
MFTIAIHGGAIVITRQSITSDEVKLFKERLDEALCGQETANIELHAFSNACQHW